MSVIVFSREEVASLNRHAQMLCSSQSGWTPEKANELACAFRVLHLAQAAASALTYGDGGELPEPFEWDGPHDAALPGVNDYHPRGGEQSGDSDDRGLRRLLSGIGHARYNTISNGGTDFLPERYAALLDCLEANLRRELDAKIAMPSQSQLVK